MLSQNLIKISCYKTIYIDNKSEYINILLPINLNIVAAPTTDLRPGYKYPPTDPLVLVRYLRQTFAILSFMFTHVDFQYVNNSGYTTQTCDNLNQELHTNLFFTYIFV